MSYINLSPNMNLPIPGVSQEPGPDWANDINNALTILDGHNHSPGSGVQITPTGLNINADLPFNSNSATALYATQFTPQASVISKAVSLYVISNELYYNDNSGHNVQITNNGSIAGASGSISGLVSPASASYNSLTQTVSFNSAATTAASVSAASVILHLSTAGSAALTLAPPSSLSADYTLTLPALPPGPSFQTLDSAGNMSTTPQVNVLTPAGVISAYVGTSAPTGYLLCDGSAVSRTTYSGLFAVIGTSFGTGDGTTTFTLPDLRGVFLRGLDGSAGRDPDSLTRSSLSGTGNTGNNVGSYEADAFQGHDHSIVLFNTVIDVSTGSSQGYLNFGGQTYNTSGIISDGNGTPRVTSETRPKNVYVNYIIKV